MKMKRSVMLGVIIGACVLACVAMPIRAQAATVTFVFNMEVDNLAPFPLINPDSYGTLTLTDSLVDPNRVDITWTFTPAFGATVERVLLNTDFSFLTNHQSYTWST